MSEQRIAFVGVGQIGGALLLRTLEALPEAEIAAYDTELTELPPGVAMARDLTTAVTGADLVIVSTPLETTLRLLPQILASDAVVLDTMSVKQAVFAVASGHPRLVGGHPMFGSENTGFAHANAAWVVGAPFVLCATEHTTAEAKTRAESFATALGANVVWRSPAEHDVQVARVSHVPQLVASALVATLEASPDAWALQGPGFRDMTRLAASPVTMWSEIARHNAPAIASALDALIAELQAMRGSLGDLRERLHHARTIKINARVPHVGMLADRVAESSTGAMLARVAALRAEGRTITGLHVGEPVVPPSAEVASVAREALRQAPICYTPTQGLAPLRERVAATARAITGVRFSTDDVLVTVGAKQALHLALAALVASGEDVLVPAPSWVSFAELVKLAGGRPVLLPCAREDGFKLTPQTLRAARNARTVALILNSPNNPTGAVYTRDELSALMAEAKGLWVISDELYRCFVFDGQHVSPLSMFADAAERGVWLDGISKSHAMTGLRIGFAAAPSALIAKMRRMKSHETSSAPSVSQAAAIALLDRFPEGDTGLIASVAARRAQLLAWAQTKPRLAAPLHGAFYAWIEARQSLRSARRLLDERDVAVMPGDAFGTPGYLRVSYATDEATLQRGLDAIAAID